jgi:trigger factor
MQITVLKSEGLDFHAKVSTPLSEINDEIKKELVDLTKKVKLAGFRAGKVPASIIQRRYGQSVRQDVIENKISHNINHIIKEHKLSIVGSPKIEDLQNDSEKDLEFVLKLELLPEITIPDLTKILIDRPILVIDAKDADEQINKLAEMTKGYTKESVDKINVGDEVTIDAIGYVNGKIVEETRLNDHKLVIGSGVFIEGFEPQLVGSKTGDEVEVNITFPEDYHAKSLAGAPTRFVVQIKAVHIPEPPEINDEFAKKFHADSLEALRDHFTKTIEAQAEEAIATVMRMNLFDQLEKLLTFNVPESLLIQENNLLKSEREKSDSDDMLLEDKSPEEIKAYYNKLALRRVRVGLMLAEYIKIKSLRLEMDDLKRAVILQAKNFPGQESAIFDFYNKNPKAIERLKGPALEEKAVQHIFDNEVKLVEKKYNKDELEKFLEAEERRVSILA